MKLIGFGLLAVVLFSSLSCYRASKYTGAGKISDRGFWSYPRYSINAGVFDLGIKNRKSFLLKGLPHTEMVLGFKVSSPTSLAKIKSEKINPLVNLILKNEKGAVVMEETHHLGEWTWSVFGSAGVPRFIYLYGNEQTQLHPKADKGHGTFFKPRTRTEYQLTVEVLETDPQIEGSFEVDILIEGGGNELP